MKLHFIIIAFIIGTLGFAQKKEKIKGSKFIKVKQHDVSAFNALKLNDRFEVFLLEGNNPSIEIEADDNLHDVIDFHVNHQGVLSFDSSHQIASKKKLNIRITVTNQFNSIIITDKAIVNTLIDLDLKTLNVTVKDQGKFYATLKTKEFSLTAEKNTKTELNLNTTNSTIILSESADIKALISANNLNIDLYQKANAKIEGDVDMLQLRIDNAANYNGEKLTANTATVIAEGSSDCDIEVKEKLTLEASGSSKINIYNSPKIDLIRFEDSAAIYKK